MQASQRRAEAATVKGWARGCTRCLSCDSATAQPQDAFQDVALRNVNDCKPAMHRAEYVEEADWLIATGVESVELSTIS